jgi:agmatinase
MDVPHAPDLDKLDADVVILGLPYGDPYTPDETVNDQTNAPTAIRRASQRLSLGWDRHDFDIGGTVLDGRDIRIADAGDVLRGTSDPPGGHYARAEAAVRKILAIGAMPIVFGGDHGVPIPVLRALDGAGPITLVQIDAHIDWRDEVNGVRNGYSNVMRRASEMNHIAGMAQLGIRGQGSARTRDVEDALCWGSVIVTAAQWEAGGTAAVLARIPEGRPYYLTIDADGLDPSVMPAVEGPAPGGLTFRQVTDLIRGLCARGRLIGMDIVEIAPRRDVNEITSLTAGNIVLNAIGAAVRSGRLGRRG